MQNDFPPTSIAVSIADRSQPSSSSEESVSIAVGHHSRSSSSGMGGLAIGIGENCQARAGEEGAIVLAWYYDTQRRVTVGYVGVDGVKADTWYTLDPEGKLLEVKE